MSTFITERFHLVCNVQLVKRPSRFIKSNRICLISQKVSFHMDSYFDASGFSHTHIRTHTHTHTYTHTHTHKHTHTHTHTYTHTHIHTHTHKHTHTQTHTHKHTHKQTHTHTHTHILHRLKQFQETM